MLTAASPAPMDMLRITHRAVATLALLLVIALVWCSWRPQPLLPVARRSVALLVLTLALTGIGIFSGDPNRVWTSFLNMLGGIALVALSWRLVLDSTYPLLAPSSMDSRPTLDTILLKSGRIVLIATIMLGALIGARYAALSCTTVPLCDGVWWPSSDGWSLLNPVRAFAPVLAPMAAGEPGGQALHLLHRMSAVLTVFVVGLLGLRALSNSATRRFGWMLLLVLLIEFALGGLTVKSGFSLILAVAHSVCAAVLLMLLVQLSSIRLKSA
jgi:cytochrome c oxidase assembly protein subunit 15